MAFPLKKRIIRLSSIPYYMQRSVPVNHSTGRLHRSDEVYNQMLVRISDGEWLEGDKIPSENQLCKMFAVSRISVRSAIQRLQGQGLLTTVQGIGSFVAAPLHDAPVQPRASSSITSAAFMEFFEFRQALEFKAIDLFVVHGNDADLRRLQEIVAKMRKAAPDDRAGFADHDYAFHVNILHGSRNTYIIGAMEPYAERYRHYLAEIVRLSSKPLAELALEHAKIVRSLRDKKPREVKEFLLADNAFYHATLFDQVR